MRIASAASAFPKHYYTQKVLLERLQDYWGDQLKNPLLLARLAPQRNRRWPLPRHSRRAVRRYQNLGPGQRHLDQGRAGIGRAGPLPRAAKCRACSRKIWDALLFTTVTGVASPSIDALLINRMKLPTNIRRTPIFGLGCVAGAAGIARASDYVRAYPKQAAALVSVELCSLTLQREDLSVANLISSGLFADGAAAVIVTGAEFESNGVGDFRT
jgi:alkylresorcinol/alkylpyrone synthase